MNPIADIEAIDYELILSDLEVVQNRAGRMAKAAKSGNNKGYNAVLARIEEHIARDDVFLFNASLFRDERVIISVFAAEQGQQIDLRV